MLKVSHVIPPSVALVAVLFWNLSQWRAVSAQEDESGDLRKRVEAVKSARDGLHTDNRQSKSKLSDVNGPIDWKSLSARLVGMRNSSQTTDFREMLGLNKRLGAMSREEIIAALDEISKLGLDDEARRSLEEVLIGPLIEKDPELALTKFASRIRDDSDGVGWQLASALESWAKKSPADASSWLDHQILAGLFESRSLDGRSDTRMEFEAAVVGVLLGSDPSAASQRIAALPEDQRREALEQITFSELGDAAQKAYVDLVRGLVPKDENSGSFTHIISELIPEGGYAKVANFLDEIHATPEEREVSARQAANSQLGALADERALTRNDVESMRDWLKTQSPGNVDTVTGEALGEVVQDEGKFSFQDASKLVLDYQKSSGSDDVLVAFLRSFAARSNLEQAASLAQMIKDPAIRQEILDGLN